MSNKLVARLIARKLSEEASPEELQQLEEIVSQDPSQQYLYDIFSAYWQSHSDPTDEQNQLADSHFNFILDSANDDEPILSNTVLPRRSSPKWPSRIAIAAILAGVCLGVYFLLEKNQSPDLGRPSHKNEVLAKTGARTKMMLPDGSSVWLNSDSKLTYNSNFNDSLREVELDGEAFFEVTKNPKRPFIVHTSNIDIRVLGTAFNVKSYPKEKTIEATLIRGSIEVFKKNEPKAPKLILRPLEKLVYQKEVDLPLKPSDDILPDLSKATHAANAAHGIAIALLPKNIPDSALEETSWIYNKLIFEGDSFHELARKMERWFDVKIIFKNDKVAFYRFRGVFENENIEQALQALQLTASFTFKIKNNEIYIDK